MAAIDQAAALSARPLTPKQGHVSADESLRAVRREILHRPMTPGSARVPSSPRGGALEGGQILQVAQRISDRVAQIAKMASPTMSKPVLSPRRSSFSAAPDGTGPAGVTHQFCEAHRRRLAALADAQSQVLRNCQALPTSLLHELLTQLWAASEALCKEAIEHSATASAAWQSHEGLALERARARSRGAIEHQLRAVAGREDRVAALEEMLRLEVLKCQVLVEAITQHNLSHEVAAMVASATHVETIEDLAGYTPSDAEVDAELGRLLGGGGVHRHYNPADFGAAGVPHDLDETILRVGDDLKLLVDSTQKERERRARALRKAGGLAEQLKKAADDKLKAALAADEAAEAEAAGGGGTAGGRGRRRARSQAEFANAFDVIAKAIKGEATLSDEAIAAASDFLKRMHRPKICMCRVCVERREQLEAEALGAADW